MNSALIILKIINMATSILYLNSPDKLFKEAQFSENFTQ